MFKFDEYPEIKKVYKQYLALEKVSQKAEAKYSKSTKEEDRLLWEKANSDRLAYDWVFSKSVLKAFVEIKPKLFNTRTEKYEKWDAVIKNKLDNLTFDEVCFLCGLITRDCLYFLPPEYYTE